ncbi:tfp pilus assembly FimV-like domain protein [Ralstonia pickettii]|nr:tfp pilus assembly FimV-like domain protein [Ralstonia pickettii]
MRGRRCHVVQAIATLHRIRTAWRSIGRSGSRSCLLRTCRLTGSTRLTCRSRCGGGRGRGLRLGSRSSRRRLNGARRRGLHHRRRREILCGIAGAHRVQQERISARNVAACPVQVDQNVNERLCDGLGRAQTHHVIAVRLAFQRGTQRGDDRVVGQSGTRIGIRRSQFGDQVLRLFGRHAGQIDFGLQRLAEAGTHMQRAETGRLRSGLNQQQACRGKRDGRPARTAMGRFSPAVLAHPHLRLRYLLMCKRT